MPTFGDLTHALILDNGGSHIKSGLVSLTAPEIPQAHVIPNALAKPSKRAGGIPPGLIKLSTKRPHGYLIGSEVYKMRNFSEMILRRPIDRGFVSAWDIQADIWRAVFEDMGMKAGAFGSMAVMVGEAMGGPLRTRRAMDELVFEEFGFGACMAGPSGRWAAGGESALVLDCGYSACTALPVLKGRELGFCVRRLGLGGKALTNYLKETVSFRSWNMMDETVIINAVKERLCFVSLNYEKDLEECKRKRSSLKKEYVLPDYSNESSDPLGHLKVPEAEAEESEQILAMNNERICVPEALFYPSDIGLQQGGIAEIITQAVEAIPEHLRAEMYGNIILAGGSCKFPNFAERLHNELRPLVPTEYEVKTNVSADPILTSFSGAAELLVNKRESLCDMLVTKAEYEEHGSRLTLERYYRF